MVTTCTPGKGVDSAPLLLSAVWTIQRVKGWWLSEKLDGVRAYWDGAALWSRDMKPLHAPAWWLAQLPAGVALDGELWCGRGRFGVVLGAVKSAGHIGWAEIKLMAFDLLAHAGTFEERQAHLLAWDGVGVVQVVRHELCEGMRHLRRALRAVHYHEGEGLMLREAGSRYVIGRSHSLLKVRWANNTELL